LATIPFPPPLDEGMSEEVWREYVMTPTQSPQPEEQTNVRILTARLHYQLLFAAPHQLPTKGTSVN